MNTAAKELYAKLDEFISRYYKNELLRGGILFAGLFFSTFLAVVMLEYYQHFGITARTVLFYTFSAISVVIFAYFIARPLLQLLRLSGGMSYKHAANIIGNHFPQVADSLLNVIQLNNKIEKTDSNKHLLVAAVEQKISNLKPIPFNIAISFSSSLRYLKYSTPPILLLVLLLSANPGVITEPAQRLIKHSTYFEKPAPFEFHLINDGLETIQQHDFKLEVKTIGEIIPEQVFLVLGNNEFLMQKMKANHFSYLIRNPREDISFYFKSDKYRSKEYSLSVYPKPLISSFSVELNYPAYTGRVKEIIDNTGDITAPEGTLIKWYFHTRNADSLKMKLGDKWLIGEKKQHRFNFATKAKETGTYTLIPGNQFLPQGDSLRYTMNIIQDAYPNIRVEEYPDTLDNRRLYFNGLIRDDYGFSRLLFKYRIKKEEGQDEQTNDISIPISKNTNTQQFFYFYDIGDLFLQAGEEVVYYFEVFDNDAVNGAKSARSALMYYKAPTKKEIDELSKKMGEDIQQKLMDNVKAARNIQRQIEDLSRKLIEKKTLNWEDRQQIRDLLSKQQELQSELEELNRINEEKAKTDQHFKEFSPELLEKQKMLEKIFNELMTDEMKELLKQLNEMVDQIDKDKLLEMMEQIKLSNEDVEKELDRTLELFKQLEFEKKMTDLIDKLDELKDSQQELKDEMDKAGDISEEQTDKQKSIEESFEELRKDLDEVRKLSEELDNIPGLPETKEREENIQQNLKNSSQSMQQGKKRNASGSQQQAADEMKKLKEEMEMFLQQMEDNQVYEDVTTLRKILENLVRISFRQENLMKQFSVTSRQDPQFSQLIENQNVISRDLKIVQDSLFELSKRQLQLESFINREISDINYNVDKALKALIDMNTVGMVAATTVQEAQRRQQNVMTSANNLSLMLAESLKQMQQQQNSGKSGENCSGKPKPGQGGKPSVSNMRQLQEQLNKQMQQLKEQMEKGGPMPGGQPSISEQLARMAAQQEAVRKMMQQYRDDMMKEGGSDRGNLANMMKEMEETETDLVNKIISRETLRRQQNILTRLLESEKAERERELDNIREATEAKNSYFSNPKDFLEYKRLKTQEEEILRSVPPNLKTFYKNKVNEYFYTLDD